MYLWEWLGTLAAGPVEYSANCQLEGVKSVYRARACDGKA